MLSRSFDLEMHVIDVMLGVFYTKPNTTVAMTSGAGLWQYFE